MTDTVRLLESARDAVRDHALPDGDAASVNLLARCILQTVLNGREATAGLVGDVAKMMRGDTE